MPQGRSYEPTIRDGGADHITRERLGSKSDPYPFIKAGDKQIYDVSQDVVICGDTFHMLDQHLTDCIYQAVEYFDQVYILRSLKNYLQTKGLTASCQRYLDIQFHTSVHTATEAMDEATAAIRSIFNKLVEYIRKVSSALSAWIKSMADIQDRSILTLKDLEEHYTALTKTKSHTVNDLTVEVANGGCPKAEALVLILQRAKHLLHVLNDQKNATNIVLVKLLQKVKQLYVTGNTNELDTFLEENEEGSIDNDILNEFAKLQDKFTGVGITFSEDMAANWEDVLEYTDESLSELGYTTDTFKQVLQAVPTRKEILGCSYVCQLLNRLSTYFSSVKVQDTSGDDEKYDTYINTIPKILTIVISVYRTSILAAREYTTTALAIEKAILSEMR